MSPKQLASTLLRFRTSTSLMIPGSLSAEIGSHAMQDALNRGWVQPDHTTGFLTLSPSTGAIQEMERLAEECCEKCKKPKCECPADEPKQESVSVRSFITGHASRLYEDGIAAPGAGQPPKPAAPATTPMTPAAPAAAKDDYTIGEDVVVADEGRTYSAKVQSKNPDGTYKLSFGPNRPLRQDRFFRGQEMQRVASTGSSPNMVKVEPH